MRAAIYLRVSTDNQERELRAAAERIGHEIVAVYRDAGISGSKGRDQRPGFDAMHKDAARRRFDVVMAWSVDRLGRSLQDLCGFPAVWLLLDYPWGLLAFVAIAALYGLR